MATKKTEKLPKSITVLGQRIKVLETKPDDGSWGDFDHDRMVIRISPDHASHDDKLKSLCHEMTHAALFIGGLSEVLGEKNEEAVVRAVENALWPHIKFRRY